MPMLPSHHGCSSSQEMVSAPSFGSFSMGTNSRPDRNVPRQSWYTTAYPASTSVNTFGTSPYASNAGRSLP